MSYMPPLRAAVTWCVSMNRGPFVPETLACVAEPATTTDRAAAYCSILVARGALSKTAAGYIPGPSWAEWARVPSRSRPTGKGTTDEASYAISRLRLSLARNLRRAREARSWSIDELARRAGVDRSLIRKAEQRCRPPSVPVLVLLTRALGLTVEDLLGPTA